MQYQTDDAFTGVTPLPAIRLSEDRDVCLAVPFRYPPDPMRSPPRVAAMVHLFSEDLASETLNVLRNVPGPLDLLITTDTGAKRQAIESVFTSWRNGTVNVCLVPNRGGDIAPRLVTLRDAHTRYDLVLYLHGKKAIHWARGAEWRKYLYQSLAGSADLVRSIFAAFAASPTLGLVLPQHWPPLEESIDWGYSFAGARDLAARMGIELRPTEPLDFPSGSMFWARPAALRPLLDLGLTAMDFSPGGGNDVTYAHAIERLFLRVCERAGHTWIKIADPALIGERRGLYSVHAPDELSRLLRELPLSLSDPGLQPGRAEAKA
jgi:lipopolysaccharide biosynthesis protein